MEEYSKTLENAPNDAAEFRVICGRFTNVATWPRGFKKRFMLNSAEHENLNSNKYKSFIPCYTHVLVFTVRRKP